MSPTIFPGMERRRLGKTGHMSSIVTFGCAALIGVSQKNANRVVRFVLEHGVNHFDVASSYGEAELRLKPILKEYRDEIFLACKTLKRRREEVAEELRRSLERLGVDYIDLYQFHALDKPEDIEVAFGPGGALEAMLEARDEGLIGHIGITSHRPPAIIEALSRFDFETILFPLNFVLKRHRCPENDYEQVLRLAKERDVGTIAMKAFAKQPWLTEKRRYKTWYEPFDTQREIDLCLWFALSEGVTTVTTPADTRLIPMVIDAAERYRELSRDEIEELLRSADNLKPLFPRE